MDIKKSRPGWLVSIGQGMAWLISAVGVILTALFVREAVHEIVLWIADRRLAAAREGGVPGGNTIRIGNQTTAFDFIGIFLLAILAIWAIVEIDNYLRKGRAKGLLFRRFLKVIGIEAGIIIGSVLLRMLLQY